MTKFEKFFTSKKTMQISFFIAALLYGIITVMNAWSTSGLSSGFFNFFVYFFVFCIVIVMYKSYDKHETNALNTLVGAMLVSYIFIMFFSLYQILSSSENITDTGMFVSCITELALILVFFINHVQLNSMHFSSHGRILLNQILFVILVCYQIFIIVFDLAVTGSSPMLVSDYIAIPVVSAVARIFVFNMIICIETRLNAYKMDREAAKAEGTWTKEKKNEAKEKYFSED